MYNTFAVVTQTNLILSQHVSSRCEIRVVMSVTMSVRVLLTCGYSTSGFQHILCVCSVCLYLVYPMLPVSLICPFFIAPSVFSNVYFHSQPSIHAFPVSIKSWVIGCLIPPLFMYIFIYIVVLNIIDILLAGHSTIINHSINYSFGSS